VRLARDGEDSPLAKRLGDPFMFHGYLAERASAEIAKEFGPSFARSVFALAPGGWKGPIESGYGWHLVFVESSTPSRVPAFAEVESDVTTAWLAAQKAEAWEKAYAKMRSRYQLALPAEVAASDQRGATAQASASP
jgi:peptidyl-prolyl cis-trans isomerase C